MFSSSQLSRSLRPTLLTLALAGWTSTPLAHAATLGKLVDVKDERTPTIALPLGDAQAEQQWSFAWNDLGHDDAAGAPHEGIAGYEALARVNGVDSKAPTVIAAPLPPALLPGLIGLAGVYAYQRRHKLR